jgi:hypothetical protein
MRFRIRSMAFVCRTVSQPPDFIQLHIQHHDI